MARIFLALSLPNKLTEILTKRQREWSKKASRKIRWIPPDNLHITMKFIGEADACTTEDIVRICDGLFKDLSPMELVLNGTGIFPDLRRPRILWAGIRDDTNRIKDLNNLMETGLASAGIPEEKKRFHPHITVARIKRPSHLPEHFKKEFIQTSFTDETFHAEALTLYRSILSPNGARYEAISQWGRIKEGR